VALRFELFSINAAVCEQYARLGVHRLILMPPPKLAVAGLERYVEDARRDVIGRVV